MQKTKQVPSLQQQWKERCQNKNFSSAVLSDTPGTVYHLDKTGDTQVTYPRISIELLKNENEMQRTLEPDEIWAVREAERLIKQAEGQKHPIYDATPGNTQAAHKIEGFNPELEHIVALSMITGG